MTDYENEIEHRLARFRSLNGRGNVRDSNHVLYEIIQLMLGMMAQSKVPPMATDPDEEVDTRVPLLEVNDTEEREIAGTHIEIDSEELLHPVDETDAKAEDHAETEASAKPKVKGKK